MAVNGGWSSWSTWQDCRCPGANLSAGKMSTRTCTNPPPSNGGQTCQGTSIKRTKDCIPCPQVEPAKWSSWSEWSECNQECNKIRKRQCLPGSDSGRKTCSGKDTQSLKCSSEQCSASKSGDMETIVARKHKGHATFLIFPATSFRKICYFPRRYENIFGLRNLSLLEMTEATSLVNGFFRDDTCWIVVTIFALRYLHGCRDSLWSL
ncbi:unnamed protein product [Phaedon cochleariae]|uniref:Uncharacterized protein n=1 Tax=Phaedon cochleariae TaxID=80249 RepID=A0A9N9SCG1_PHACE|nr:unnamed protein product [Phaedon cochleariae]